MTHHLKTKSKYFQAVFDGQKSFEIRKDDRNFMADDIVELEEINGVGEKTGRNITAKIIRLFDLAEAQLPGYVAFTFVVTERYNYDHLTKAFKHALEAAQCFKDAPDVGTFNLDSAYIRLPGADEEKVLAAAKQAGIDCYAPSLSAFGYDYSLGGTTGHQSRRTDEAEAIAASLNADGYCAYVKYVID